MELFGTTRDEWIARDLEGWLNANEIYEGMPEIVGHLRQQQDTYIVTTKQVHAVPCMLAAGRAAGRCACASASALATWPARPPSHRRASRRL